MRPDIEKYSLDKGQVRRSFERAAISYDSGARLQREVCGRLLERLGYIRLRPRLILDLGAGTGQGALALRDLYPKARVVAVDFAYGMLEVVVRKSPWLRKPRVVCADAEQLPIAEQSIDLVFSSQAFQWCANLDSLFKELRRILKPDGLLLFTTCGPDTLQELRMAWAEVDDAVHVNAFVDMHDLGDAMVRAGLVDSVLDVERIRRTYPQFAELSNELRATGARNFNAGRPVGLTGKQKFAALVRAYERYRADNLLPASYEIIFGQAWGSAERTRAVNEAPIQPVAIPLSTIRRR